MMLRPQGVQEGLPTFPKPLLGLELSHRHRADSLGQLSQQKFTEKLSNVWGCAGRLLVRNVQATFFIPQ